MPHRVHFVTDNPHKVAWLNTHLAGLGLEVVHTQIPLIEPQLNTVDAVALSKAVQAFNTLKEPVLVEDGGFFIDELSGFPGPYTKYVLGTIGAEGVLKVADSLATRGCKFISAVAYIDSDGVPRIFIDDSDKGTLATYLDHTPCDEAWSDLWRIFIPDGYSAPLTTLTGVERAASLERWQSSSAFSQFISWLQSRRSISPQDATPDSSGRLISSAFEFSIPRERIAMRPRPHGQHKLLVYTRKTREISHHIFDEIGALLPKGTVIVVNNSKVVKAALRKAIDDGTYLHVLTPSLPDLEEVETLCPWKPAPGEVIKITGGCYIVTSAPVAGRDIRLGKIIPDDPSIKTLQEFLERHGSIPIPIYVNSERKPDEADRRDYQNCYAKIPGSIECPTAGLHFHPQLMASMERDGFEFIEVTLHIGYGTWKSLKTNFVDEHDMDTEEIIVEADAIQQIREAKAAGRSVLAVGTSSVRTLESIAPEIFAPTGVPTRVNKRTNLFIHPPYKFQVADMLITNFAYPRTPIMALAATFTGLAELKHIYKEALEKDYLFYTYGDAILIV